jgi:hypothetical protein
MTKVPSIDEISLSENNLDIDQQATSGAFFISTKQQMKNF